MFLWWFVVGIGFFFFSKKSFDGFIRSRAVNAYNHSSIFLFFFSPVLEVLKYQYC